MGAQGVDLLPREFALSEHLLRRKGRLQTRTMLMKAVRHVHCDPQANVVDTHISPQRAKVAWPFGAELIETARGAGCTIQET